MRNSWKIFVAGAVFGLVIALLVQPHPASSSQFFNGSAGVQIWHGNKPLTGPVTITLYRVNNRYLDQAERPTLRGRADRRGSMTSTFSVPADGIPQPVLDFMVQWMRRPRYQNPGL